MKEPTDEEIRLADALRKEGLLSVSSQVHDGKKTVDLKDEEARVDIEVDGSWHLTNPFQVNRDMDRSYHSQIKDGYNTIHVPNREVWFNLPKLAHSIATALKYRARRIKYGHKKKR
jgi:very-short-patch-repair endonuclease